MIDEYLINILIMISGFGSGLFVGIASGTAGAIMIPCLTIFVGYSVHQAIGTSLLVDCVIGGVAGLIFLRNGNVDFKPVIALAFMGVIGAFVGSMFTSGTSEFGLSLLIGLFLILVGVNFIINGIQKNIDFVEGKINFNFFRDKKIYTFVILGLLVGFASGFAGMGSSSIVAVILIFVLGYNLRTAIGTSLLMMSFIAGSGATGHFLNGEVVVNVALIAVCAAAVGSVTGSLVACRIGKNKLGKLIGVVVLVMGMMVFIKIFL